jgi:hypothetical protein
VFRLLAPAASIAADITPEPSHEPSRASASL